MRKTIGVLVLLLLLTIVSCSQASEFLAEVERRACDLPADYPVIFWGPTSYSYGDGLVCMSEVDAMGQIPTSYGDIGIRPSKALDADWVSWIEWDPWAVEGLMKIAEWGETAITLAVPPDFSCQQRGSFSADGERFVFAPQAWLGWPKYVVMYDTVTEDYLYIRGNSSGTSEVECDYPVISLDGDKVYYSEYEWVSWGGRNDLYEYDVSSETTINITDLDMKQLCNNTWFAGCTEYNGYVVYIALETTKNPWAYDCNLYVWDRTESHLLESFQWNSGYMLRSFAVPPNEEYPVAYYVYRDDSNDFYLNKVELDSSHEKETLVDFGSVEPSRIVVDSGNEGVLWTEERDEVYTGVYWAIMAYDVDAEEVTEIAGKNCRNCHVYGFGAPHLGTPTGWGW